MNFGSGLDERLVVDDGRGVSVFNGLGLEKVRMSDHVWEKAIL